MPAVVDQRAVVNTITLPVSVVRALCDLALVTEEDGRTQTEAHALEAALAALDVAKHAQRVEELTS